MRTPSAACALLDASAQTPLAFEIAWRDGVLQHRVRAVAATDWQAVAAPALWANQMPRAPGSTLQRLDLRFRSQGYFSHNPSGHFALGLRARTLLPPDDPPPGGLEGIGVVIGNVSEAPGGCALPPCVQIESFWRGGNQLAVGTGGPPLCEAHWYALALAADDHGGLRYALRDESGALLAECAYRDTQAWRRAPDLGGWFLGAGFAEQSSGEWCAQFEDFRLRWSAD
jgi:hypothetical protein